MESLMSEFENYLLVSKRLQQFEDNFKYEMPYHESFENIFKKSLEAKVTQESAKCFLQTLSAEELLTLQSYFGLSDSIELNALSDTEAFYLLHHNNESSQSEENSANGSVHSDHVLIVPKGMTADIRDAYVEAMNTLNNLDRLKIIALTLEPSYHGTDSSKSSLKQPIIDYAYMQQQIKQRLDPAGDAFTSQSTKKSIQKFKDAFETAFEAKNNKANQNRPNNAVNDFLKELRTKGAAQFLADLNQEKIDTLIAEYEKQLKELFDDSLQTQEEITTLVDSFKNQLVRNMKGGMLEDEAKEGQALYGLKNIKSTTFLQDLLK